MANQLIEIPQTQYLALKELLKTLDTKSEESSEERFHAPFKKISQKDRIENATQLALNRRKAFLRRKGVVI